MMVAAQGRDPAQPRADRATACRRSCTAGPFANIAHGCNSVIATKLALARADWVGHRGRLRLRPRRREVLRHQVRVGRPRHRGGRAGRHRARAQAARRRRRRTPSRRPTPAAVERGLGNLAKHVENIRTFGESPVVALNRFATDTDEEIEVVRPCVRRRSGVPFAVSDVFARGGEGGVELAEAVDGARRAALAAVHAALRLERADHGEDGEDRARDVRRARGGVDARRRERDLAQIEKLGFGGLPLCIAKTQKSLSDDPQVRRAAGGLRDHRARRRSSPPAPATSCRCSATSCGCPACRRRRRPSAWTSSTAAWSA